MENLEKNYRNVKLVIITRFFFIGLILIALVVSCYYNMTLQDQVNQRDILIEKLSSRDSILNTILEFKYDSISRISSYTTRIRNGKVLKYNELSQELDETLNKMNQISITNIKIVDVKNQTLNDFNTLSKDFISLNKKYSELINKYNSLVDEYNSFLVTNKKLKTNFYQVSDSLSSFKTIIKLIKSNYDISYYIIIKEDIKTISIKAEQIDSALILLPYFRNRLNFDNERNVWTIKTGKK